jgi:hypothetical protein
MAVHDFWPFHDNQKITASQWNELMVSIQNGSFFLDTAPIADQINSLSARQTALELRVGELEALKSYQHKTMQYQLAQHQVRIELENPARLDSEILALNGTVLSKNGIPLGFVGDYAIDGNVITLNDAWIPLVAEGDMLVVNYEFEVLI